MNKFCKSCLCVEKVRESYVLIGQLVVEVPGCVDTVRIVILLLASVKSRLCGGVLARCPCQLRDIVNISGHTVSEGPHLVPAMC